MSRRMRATAIAMICLSFLGCGLVPQRGGDPLTQFLRDQDYHAFNPPRSRATVGDIVRNDSRSADVAPIVLVSEVMSSDERTELMESARHDVSLPSVSGNTSYTLDAEAAIVGVFSGELKANGVKKYRVKVIRPREYEISQIGFRTQVEDRIREQFREGESLDKKHYMYALLEADGVEYEFLDAKGATVQLAPDGEIAEVVKSQLQSGWEISSDGRLVTTEPRFIGYRTHQIKDRTDSAGMVYGEASAWAP